MSLVYETSRREVEDGIVVVFTIEGFDSKAQFALFCTNSCNDLTDYESFYGDDDELMHAIELHRKNFDHTEPQYFSTSHS
ncbi:hypothetical protein [Pseudomonas putida]